VLPLTNPASHASANITEKNQSMVLTPTVLCFVYDCGKNVKICVTLECRIDLDERPEPSHLTSKSHSEWQNRSRVRPSGIGWNCGRGIFCNSIRAANATTQHKLMNKDDGLSLLTDETIDNWHAIHRASGSPLSDLPSGVVSNPPAHICAPATLFRRWSSRRPLLEIQMPGGKSWIPRQIVG